MFPHVLQVLNNNVRSDFVLIERMCVPEERASFGSGAAMLNSAFVFSTRKGKSKAT